MSCILGSSVSKIITAVLLLVALSAGPALADTTVKGSSKYATPDFNVNGNRVTLGSATQSYALVVDKPPYNALCDGVTDDSTAFATWFADIVSSGRPGVIPPRACRINSQLYWNVTSVAATGITIVGSGIQKSKLLLTTTTGPAMRIGGNAGTYSFINLSGFAVQCALAEACVELGHSDYSDIINSAVLDIYISNTNATSSAVAARFNDYRNSPQTLLIANTGGSGIDIDCRQCISNTWFGSLTSAATGIKFRDGNSYSNSFVSVNISGITGGTTGGPVVSSTANAARNTWIGGSTSWVNSSATGGAARLDAATGTFRFIGTKFARSDAASIFPIGIGANASAILVDVDVEGSASFARLDANKIVSPIGADAGSPAEQQALIWLKSTDPSTMPRYGVLGVVTYNPSSGANWDSTIEGIIGLAYLQKPGTYNNFTFGVGGTAFLCDPNIGPICPGGSLANSNGILAGIYGSSEMNGTGTAAWLTGMYADGFNNIVHSGTAINNAAAYLTPPQSGTNRYGAFFAGGAVPPDGTIAANADISIRPGNLNQVLIQNKSATCGESLFTTNSNAFVSTTGSSGCSVSIIPGASGQVALGTTTSGSVALRYNASAASAPGAFSADFVGVMIFGSTPYYVPLKLAPW
jgi:hypothetical protein